MCVTTITRRCCPGVTHQGADKDEREGRYASTPHHPSDLSRERDRPPIPTLRQCHVTWKVFHFQLHLPPALRRERVLIVANFTCWAWRGCPVVDNGPCGARRLRPRL